MPIEDTLAEILGTDDKSQACGYCGERVDKQWKKKLPYLKINMWPQYPLFSFHWMKQFFVGDNRVARFCSEEHFKNFVNRGLLKELEK